MNILGFNLSRSKPAAVNQERVEPVLAASEGVPVNASRARLMEAGFGRSTVKGAPIVTPRNAESHATVFACCNVIAGDLAKIPLHVMQRGKNGEEVKVSEHGLAYLLNAEAAPGVPSMTMRFAAIYAFALRGTGLAYAPRDGAGEIELIETVRPDRCSIFQSGRDRFYQFEDGANVLRTIGGRQMVHMRYMAEDGWEGRSPITVAADSMGLALAGQAAAVKSATGANIRAVATLEGHYSDEEQYQRNARRLKEGFNTDDGVAIVGAGDNITTLNMSAADMQLLENRKFDREMIAAIYRVPPSKLQMLEHGVKANGQQQSIDYKTDCLLHWGGFAGTFFAATLLTETERRAGLFLRHDYAALMEATTKESYDAITKAVGGPFMTPDEGRALDGRGPIEGGDKLYPPPNMTRDDKDDGAEKTETEGGEE